VFPKKGLEIGQLFDRGIERFDNVGLDHSYHVLRNPMLHVRSSMQALLHLLVMFQFFAEFFEVVLLGHASHSRPEKVVQIVEVRFGIFDGRQRAFVFLRNYIVDQRFGNP